MGYLANEDKSNTIIINVKNNEGAEYPYIIYMQAAWL